MPVNIQTHNSRENNAPLDLIRGPYEPAAYTGCIYNPSWRSLRYYCQTVSTLDTRSPNPFPPYSQPRE